MAIRPRSADGIPADEPAGGAQMVGHSVIGMALIAEAGVLLKGRPVWEQVYGAVPGRSIVVLRSRAVLLNDHYP